MSIPPTLIKKSHDSFMAGLGVPGAWWLWKMGTGSVVMVCCPQCKRIIHLSQDHQIAPDGTVTPSCVCPTSYCEFHANVKLDEWNPATQVQGG